MLACIIFAILLARLGRKTLMLWAMFFTAVICLVYAFLDKTLLATYASMLGSRFTSVGAFWVL